MRTENAPSMRRPKRRGSRAALALAVTGATVALSAGTALADDC